MPCVVSGKIAAAGSQTAFASTHSRICTRPSPSLSPYPSQRRQQRGLTHRRRHFVFEFGSGGYGSPRLRGSLRFQNAKALGVPGGLPSWQHTEEKVESPKRAQLDAILKRQLFKTLRRHFVLLIPVRVSCPFFSYEHTTPSCS